MEKKFKSKDDWLQSMGIGPDGSRGRIYHNKVFTDKETPSTIITCRVCNDLYDGSIIEYCPYCAYTLQQRRDYVTQNIDKKNQLTDMKYKEK